MTESIGEIALRDAALSVSTWTARAKNKIDEDFEPGYAEKHPELVAAFIKAAATHYLADMVSRAITDAAERLADEWSEQAPTLPAL